MPLPLHKSGPVLIMKIPDAGTFFITGCYGEEGLYIDEETVHLEGTGCYLKGGNCRCDTTDAKSTDIKI